MSVELAPGLRVFELGYGAMGLSGTYGAVDEAAARAALNAAVDAGITLIDTADVYGAGANERLVGRALRDRRDEVSIATKVGFLPEPDAEGLRVRGDAEHIRAGVERSLERLGIERIDLYYLHRVDPRVPIEESTGALAQLVDRGLVARIGLSEVTGAELARAHAVHPISAVQSEWSIWSRDVEDHVVPTAARLGIGLVPYAPLGRGFLAGTAPQQLADGDLRRNFPRFDADARAANERIAAVVRAQAEGLGISPAQLALAWLRQRAERLAVVAVPIPGTRRPDRIRENIDALAIDLPRAVIEVLDELGAAAVGDRARDASAISQGRERLAG